MALGHNPSIVTSGLVLCLDAGNPRSYAGSGTTWYDVSNNQTTCALNNGPSFTSGTNGYFTFDNVDDYGQTATTVLPTAILSPITLEAVCYTTSTAIAYQTVLGTAGSLTQIGFATSNFAGGRNGGGGGILNTSLAAISANTWYHMVMTYDGTNGRFYLNGSLISTTGIGSNGVNNGVSLLSTYTSGTAAERLQGRIAIARAYNVQLTTDQVLQNFEAIRSRYSI